MARNMMLHTFGVRPKGTLRSIGWVITVHGQPRVVAAGERRVDVRAMGKAFVKGIEMFLSEALAGSRQACIRKRLNELLVQYHLETA
jgi:hypothetical protein